MRRLLDELFTAARKGGGFRADIGVGDLAMVMSLLARHVPAVDAGTGR